MITKQAIERLIISGLRNSYGIQVDHIRPLTLGADADAVVYKIQSHNKKTYFVKLKRVSYRSVPAKPEETIGINGQRQNRNKP